MNRQEERSKLEDLEILEKNYFRKCTEIGGKPIKTSLSSDPNVDDAFLEELHYDLQRMALKTENETLRDEKEKLIRENKELMDLCIQSQLNRTVYVKQEVSGTKVDNEFLDELSYDLREVKNEVTEALATIESYQRKK